MRIAAISVFALLSFGCRSFHSPSPLRQALEFDNLLVEYPHLSVEDVTSSSGTNAAFGYSLATWLFEISAEENNHTCFQIVQAIQAAIDATVIVNRGNSGGYVIKDAPVQTNIEKKWIYHFKGLDGHLLLALFPSADETSVEGYLVLHESKSSGMFIRR